jgi:septal ring factor EnvC (AmiA/AmiB activator)
VNPWLTFAAALVASGLGGGGVVALLKVPALKRKLRSESHLTDADAEAKLTETALTLLEPARQEVERLSQRLTNAETLVDRLTNDLRSAHAEVASLRGQVDLMSKDLEQAREENDRLRTPRKR